MEAVRTFDGVASVMSFSTICVIINLACMASAYVLPPDALKPGMSIPLHVDTAMSALLKEEDTDGDRRITIEDTNLGKGIRGDARFMLVDTTGNKYCIESTYRLSVLLQELALMRKAGKDYAALSTDPIFENPVDRTSRLIRELYWDKLTRRVDIDNLKIVLPDDKYRDFAKWYLYVSSKDSTALSYFSGIDAAVIAGKRLEVDTLPEPVTPRFVRSLDGRHGILPLALRSAASGGGMEGVPYVVPGGRFNEMYGWDSYFEALGLIEDDRLDLAKGMVDNFIYEIEHYGMILNGNRTYYLTRSQPPFLTSMALAVYEKMDGSVEAREWLKGALRAAIKEYRTVWAGADRMTETGLSRYYGSGLGKPPEVEEGHFNDVYSPLAEERGISVEEFEALYVSGRIEVPELDLFHMHDRAMRESGHDTSYRWFVSSFDSPGAVFRERCADFVTVDLNCLLHKYEIDIARTLRDEFGGTLDTKTGEPEYSGTWYEMADKRRNNIRKYLWNDSLRVFLDWNYVNSVPRYYVTAATFYPLWACHADDPSTYIIDSRPCSVMVTNALCLLEESGGLAASAEESLESVKRRGAKRQWDYPFGWAPHQMIAWIGLKNYGFESEANRLIYKWLYMMVRSAADYNGTIPEKYDVVSRTHDVFAEYGNVGTKFDYITLEGFGWMNASCQVGLSYLPPEYRRKLEALIPPEQLFVAHHESPCN
jgi:alpha,alpha-trehalase